MGLAKNDRTFTFDKVLMNDGELYVSAREVAEMIEATEDWRTAASMRKMIDEAERTARNGH